MNVFFIFGLHISYTWILNIIIFKEKKTKQKKPLKMIVCVSLLMLGLDPGEINHVIKGLLLCKRSVFLTTSLEGY